MFRARRADAPIAVGRHPVSDAHPDEIEGVTLEIFAAFIARVGQPEVVAIQHETIAYLLGFPEGRYDLIRNAWLARIYSSPAIGKEFGTLLDASRSTLKSH